MSCFHRRPYFALPVFCQCNKIITYNNVVSPKMYLELDFI